MNRTTRRTFLTALGGGSLAAITCRTPPPVGSLRWGKLQATDFLTGTLVHSLRMGILSLLILPSLGFNLLILSYTVDEKLGEAFEEWALPAPLHNNDVPITTVLVEAARKPLSYLFWFLCALTLLERITGLRVRRLMLSIKAWIVLYLVIVIAATVVAVAATGNAVAGVVTVMIWGIVGRVVYGAAHFLIRMASWEEDIYQRLLERWGDVPEIERVL